MVLKNKTLLLLLPLILVILSFLASLSWIYIMDSDDYQIKTAELQAKNSKSEKQSKLYQNRITDLYKIEEGLSQNLISTASILANYLPVCNNISLTTNSAISKNPIIEVFSKKLDDKISIIGVFPEPTMIKTHKQQFFTTKTIIKAGNKIHFSIIDKTPIKKTKVLQYVAVIKSKYNNMCQRSFQIAIGEEFKEGLTKHKLSRVFGRVGYGPGTFSLPYGTDFIDNIFYVSDCTNENISTFSKTGEFLKYSGNFGTRLGQFDTPADIKVRGERIYVVEERNHRVQVLDINGNPKMLRRRQKLSLTNLITH